MTSSPRHDLVNHAIDLFPAPADARERLTQRRARQQRKRRLVAGAVGVVVALATAAALAYSIESAQVPADRTPPPPPSATGVSGALVYALDGDIYVADPDASNAVKIAAPDEGCEGRVGSQMPEWSPDGRFIAFQRGCWNAGALTSAAVMIADPDGTVVAEFTTDVRGMISWSPDSTRIAAWDTFGREIGIYGVDGVRLAALASPLPGKAAENGPQWLQDGSALLLSGYAPPSSMVLPLDGSPAYEYAGELPNPSWASPDGDRTASINERGELIVRDVASGKVTVLTEAKASLPEGARLNVVRGFSPQGDRILYAVFVRDGYNNLYSIGVDGSDPHRLVVGAMQGQWRPR